MLNLFYGGTFDPVHNGHLAIACAARDALQTQVRLMPASDPPHREPPGANAMQRTEMLELAIAGETGLVVDRRELQRQGRSYSIETLRDVRAELGPEPPLALLVGADSFIGLPTWREWRELFGLAHFVVAQRPGSSLDAALPDALADMLHGRWVDDAQTLQHSAAGRVFRIDQPLHAESASEVRRLIAAAAPWRHLVPRAVADFIAENGLYAQPP